MDCIEIFGVFSLWRPHAQAQAVITVAFKPSIAISCPSTGSRRRRRIFYRALEEKSLSQQVFSETSSSKSDVDYLGQSTKGDLNIRQEHLEAFGMDREAALDGPIEEIAKTEVKEAEALLSGLGIMEPFTARHSAHGIFCSRTLNFRSISAIGYDMDYTLIHYNVMAWEGRAYDYGMANLESMGFPVDDLKFDPNLVCLKGHVKEMVDRLDEGTMPAILGPLDYKGLFKAVSKALFRAHVEGQLKREIMAEPERFVEPDHEIPLALLDQKEAGKKLLLITNSDYHYTNKMMHYAFNRFLPNDMGWRDLFDMVIVSARKPEFFQMSHPLYEVVTADGLMRPCFKAHSGGLYSGGSAQIVEKSLGFQGDEILYVGDHIFTDVSQSKVHLRWRTALICRELEDEFNALVYSRDHRKALIKLVHQKDVVGDLFNQLRLALQRRSKDRPAQTLAATKMADHELTENMQKLLIVMQRLDQKIGPMLEADGEYFNKRWGYISRAGLWDKSHLTRQIEKYADIYTSRVSNFLHYTPFMYFCSQEQTIAHDLYSYTSNRIGNHDL
ncbi:cytosolic purine 5'-nucleotidase isoform X2 [Phalaenopsis equestris]|uniref:cytosolic purine 5'-nucleotidase isoform X2 n=1 Tax=Phalaenopsis equestris TaxID=78828 RepID=UPI0009E52092|nr:cytosolic purine 5'-nucleotidase isoform X2 [Phalaenopsis equestris]